MRAWLKKAAGYLLAFLGGILAALVFVLGAIFGQWDKLKEGDDAQGAGDISDTDRDLAEAAKRAAISRAIDRAKAASRARADGSGADGDPHPGD